MGSSDTLRENQGAAERVRRSDREIDEYWSSVVMEEPVSDDLKVLVRADLKKAWHFFRNVEFRENTKARWATTDYFRIFLENTVGKMELRKSKYLCNKSTAFYWLQSAQQTDAFGQRIQRLKSYSRLSTKSGFDATIPSQTSSTDISLQTPVRITSTGPSTVRGVIDAHRSLCTQASSLIN
jgi:hypothetical protein